MTNKRTNRRGNKMDIEFVGKCKYDENAMRIKDKSGFYYFSADVTFEDGFANFTGGEDLCAFITMVSWINYSDSNFRSEFSKAFNCDETEIKGIKITFNDVEVTITEQDVSNQEIYDEYIKAKDEYDEKCRLEREAYEKTKEYQDTKKRKLDIKELILKVDETTEMEFKDSEAKTIWDDCVQRNSHDSYSEGVVIYARLWAKYMQYVMKKENKSVEEIAEDTSYRAAEAKPVSGAMFNFATSMIIECWKYGDELKQLREENRL